jgi:hydroxymethylbilane synthase
MTRLRYATRKSALALAQSRMVMRLVCEARPGVTVEEVQVVTQGDRVVDRPLAEIGGKGLFVKEIEEALLDGRADVAVHSMKDLPADLAEGLVVGCVPERESPYDLLVTVDGRSLDALAQGARVGTSSRRREVALRALRPDLEVRMLRGNVDTRVRKLREGEYDAIVLAEAGVRRLGVAVEAVRLEGVIVPAVAQGALALETRAEDKATWEVVRVIHHLATERETEAERAVMRALGGSCTVPMGALARYEAGTERMTMEGFYAGDDGSLTARATLEGSARDPDEARALGQKLAEMLRRRADSARA